MIAFEPVSVARAEQCLAPLIGSAKVDTSDGLCSVREIIGGGRAFEGKRGGVPVVLIVIQKVDHAKGRELEIRAAVALGGAEEAVTDEVLAEVEAAWGYDCDVMTIYTRRAGLVRKLERAGYREAAKIMRKKVEKCTA